MGKQLIYEGCQGKDAALVKWVGGNNPDSPHSYKSQLTPIRVYLNSPQDTSGLSIYQGHDLVVQYRTKEITTDTPDGKPLPYWSEPNEIYIYVYGVPTQPVKVQDDANQSHYLSVVHSVMYDYVYDEITEQYQEVVTPFDYTQEFLYGGGLEYTRDNGQTIEYYGECEVLSAYVLDRDGNRYEFGNVGSGAYILSIEAETDYYWEEIFTQTFAQLPTDIHVDCDQCSNNCLKVTSDDKKRFICVCREVE